MARAKSNGNGRLDEAMAALAQAQTNLVQAQAASVLNQTAMAQHQTAFLARMTESDARMAEMARINSARFAAIDQRFDRIEAILIEHSRILHALPDAIRDGQSILDSVRDQARKMQPVLGANDREKLDEYFTSVRELEQRLVQDEEWSKKPKPKVNAKPPQNITNGIDLVGKTRIWFDFIHLALQTDSTRLVTLTLLGTSGVPPVQGVTLGHHDLSHHGQDPTKIDQLKKVELEKMKTLRDFLAKLKETKEEGDSLLDRTMVFFSSNLGDAATHGVKNLPVLLAGGGFKHGQHLACDPKNPPPLSNLYVSMLQRMGIEADKFGSSTGTLTGLT